MSAWRREALARLPEHRLLIETSPAPRDLWFDLRQLFERACGEDHQESTRQILDYGLWCLSPEAGPEQGEIHQAAGRYFFRSLGRPRYWPRYQEWFTPHQFRLVFPHLDGAEDEETAEEIWRWALDGPLRRSRKQQRKWDQWENKPLTRHHPETE